MVNVLEGDNTQDLLAEILQNGLEDAPGPSKTAGPAFEAFLVKRSMLVCVALNTTVKELEKGATAQNLTQTTQALLVLQTEVQRRPAILLRRAGSPDASLRSPNVIEEQSEELCIWLIPRFVRIMLALAGTQDQTSQDLMLLLRSVIVQTLRQLCGSQLVAEGGPARAREIILELLRLCTGLCPVTGSDSAPPRSQHTLFGDADAMNGDDPFDIETEGNHRPFRISCPRSTCTFVAAHLLHTCAEVALAPLDSARIVIAATLAAAKLLETTAQLITGPPPTQAADLKAFHKLISAILAPDVLAAESGTGASWQRFFDALIRSMLEWAVSDMKDSDDPTPLIDHADRVRQICSSMSAIAQAARAALSDNVQRYAETIAKLLVPEEGSAIWPSGRLVVSILLLAQVRTKPATTAYHLLDDITQASFEGQVLALKTGDVGAMPPSLGNAVVACPIAKDRLMGRKRKRGATDPPTSPAANASHASIAWVERVNVILMEDLGEAPIRTPSDLHHVVAKLTTVAFDLDTDDFQKTVRAVSKLACAFGGDDGGRCSCHDLSSPSPKEERMLNIAITESLLRHLRLLSRGISPEIEKKRLTLLRTLTRCLGHSRIVDPGEELKQWPLLVPALLSAKDRSTRLAAGQLCAIYLKARQRSDATSTPPEDIDAILRAIDNVVIRPPLTTQETASYACASIAKFAEGETLSRVLLSLVKLLGGPLGGVAFLRLCDLLPLRAATPYKLVAPHMRLIGPWLAEQVMREEKSSSLWSIKALSSFVRAAVESFVKSNVVHLLPTIIRHKRRDALEAIATAVQTEVGELCSYNATPILSYLLLEVPSAERKECLDFLVSVIPHQIDLRIVVSAHLTHLLCDLLTELGSARPGRHGKVEAALRQVESIRSGTRKASKESVAKMLSEQVLAILTRISDDLNDLHGKRTASEKCNIIRGLGHFIELVGPNIVTVSPQIMAALQSTLRSDGLVKATLQTWYTFVSVQKYDTLGPLIGSTSAAFVREWPRFGELERSVAYKLLKFLIADNSIHLARYVDDVADLSSISELAEIQKQIDSVRPRRAYAFKLDAAVSRILSENESIELQGLRDLTVQLRKPSQIAPLASGDTFDPVLGRLVNAVISSITRDGAGREEIQDLAYRNIGLVGPLDPDRLDLPPDDAPFVVLHNWFDHEENIRFCMHLIRHALVGVYRSSIDMKHQTALAYAIQELLKYCGLTKDVANPNMAGQTLGQQKLWHSLPEAVLETITPLLDSKFSVLKSGSHIIHYPFFTNTSSYREWIRCWALAVIDQCRGLKCGKIFGVISSAVKFSDVGVSQQLMPHLVLTAMLSGTGSDRQSIVNEFVLVLRNQLNPQSLHSADSRALCAQTVFALMDHIGRYLRLRKVQKPVIKGSKHLHTPADREAESQNKAATERVESIMCSVDSDLQARAALESRSFSRSLLNFEEVLRSNRFSDHADPVKAQLYLELLHQVYAELDEPDGMEGISTLIINPSVWTQIREHESTGRWTSAQSCWEVQLQSDAGEPKSHIGLLKCLRNLGHYDSMRTHISGVLQAHPDWRPLLAPFEIESALVFGDWNSLRSVLQIPDLRSHEAAFGHVLLTMREQDYDKTVAALAAARQQIGSSILSAGKVSYHRIYDTCLNLNVLHELEFIFQTAHGDRSYAKMFDKVMDSRLEASSPAFRVRESLLNMRRAGIRLSAMPEGNKQIGPMWLETAKIARKAGHMQTAYSAVLRAAQLDTPATFLQSAQLKHDEHQVQKAIQELATVLAGQSEQVLQRKQQDEALAKAALRSARWKDEAGRFEHNEVASLFRQAATLRKDWETPFYDLGHYYDDIWKRLSADSARVKLSAHELDLSTRLPPLIVSNLHHALRYGSKYVFQALPRLITIWLELGNDPGVQAYEDRKDKDRAQNQPDLSSNVKKMFHVFDQVQVSVHKASKDLPSYQWLTVYPQLVARVMHRLKRSRKLLMDLLIKTMSRYPEQCLWWIVGSVKSTQRDRMRVCQHIMDQALQLDARLNKPINNCVKMVDQMLSVCEIPLQNDDKEFSLKEKVPGLVRLLPSTMIIPIQSSMVAAMPPRTVGDVQSFSPFPAELPTFASVADRVDIMSSVARPRKLAFKGSDGRTYPFLLKPRDDLRKDARMMDFSAMINKLLKRDTDSRRRQLHIRTYGVVPLNETCGIIEWVANVSPLRPTLLQLYEARGLKKWFHEDIKKQMESYRQQPEDCAERFKRDLIDKWPGVFHEWFLDTFPEPSAWLRARLAYARTYAVMCMVGFVVGLGDRHCENILFDSNTGEVLHVDLNCLFEAGKLFEIGEKVPFRLTTNLVDALGVTGVEGVFRRACEVAMRILRHNRDSLMSVLEAFVHDPLTEWSGQEGEKKRKRKAEDSDRVLRQARKALHTIDAKLRGTRITHESIDKAVAHSPDVQVDSLIKEAQDLSKLAQMYAGWIPYF